MNIKTDINAYSSTLNHSSFVLSRSVIGVYAKLLLPLLFCFAFSACSSSGLKGIAESPTVQVHKVEMGNFNLSGGSAIFVLNINNPNSFPIPLTGFDYGLSLNGIEVANGIKEQRITLGANQSQKLEVPLILSFSNMLNMLPNLLLTRKVDYSLNGRLHFPWIKIPFQRTGGATL